MERATRAIAPDLVVIEAAAQSAVRFAVDVAIAHNPLVPTLTVPSPFTDDLVNLAPGAAATRLAELRHLLSQPSFWWPELRDVATLPSPSDVFDAFVTDFPEALQALATGMFASHVSGVEYLNTTDLGVRLVAARQAFNTYAPGQAELILNLTQAPAGARGQLAQALWGLRAPAFASSDLARPAAPDAKENGRTTNQRSQLATVAQNAMEAALVVAYQPDLPFARALVRFALQPAVLDAAAATLLDTFVTEFRKLGETFLKLPVDPLLALADDVWSASRVPSLWSQATTTFALPPHLAQAVVPPTTAAGGTPVAADIVEWVWEYLNAFQQSMVLALGREWQATYDKIARALDYRTAGGTGPAWELTSSAFKPLVVGQSVSSEAITTLAALLVRHPICQAHGATLTPSVSDTTAHFGTLENVLTAIAGADTADTRRPEVRIAAAEVGLLNIERFANRLTPVALRPWTEWRGETELTIVPLSEETIVQLTTLDAAQTAALLADILAGNQNQLSHLFVAGTDANGAPAAVPVTPNAFLTEDTRTFAETTPVALPRIAPFTMRPLLRGRVMPDQAVYVSGMTSAGFAPMPYPIAEKLTDGALARMSLKHSRANNP